MSRRRGRAHAPLSDNRRRWSELIVAGGLSEIGREAFSDFRIEVSGTNTALIRDLDQAALFGTLNRILSLGFELIELRRLTESAN